MMHNTGTSGATTTVGSALLGRGPQPGWMTLDDARERAFTGEIVFEVEPEVRVYVDNGIVYYAERSTDVSLAQRLLAKGLVDDAQLERGTVRVGDVEHLGRLFDRASTVDRDAVLVATELETAALVASIANETICTVRSTAYRHHPSGLHRWFVAPVDGFVDRRFGGIALLDSRVVDDVPGLPIVTEHTLVDELYIEWDEPIIGGARVDADETVVEEFDDSLLQAMLDESVMEYDVIEFDEVPEIDREMYTVEVEFLDVEELGPPSIDDVAFESPAIGDVDHPADHPADHATTNGAVVDHADSGEFVVMWPSDTDEVGPVHETRSVDELAMSPIEMHDREVVADVPSEVAAAVKRALAALERITQEHPVVAPILQPSEFDDVHAPVAPAPASPAFGGFAPPSPDTSAEAIYAREVAQMEAVAAAAEMVSFDPHPDLHADLHPDDDHGWPVEPAAVSDPAVVSAVHETPPIAGDDADDRSSALRRLIGSLRRKDH